MQNLCLDKAVASGIRSARLPIGTYLAELKTRKVLTVNQTFEILLKWAETKNWKTALEEVIPKRKFNEKGRAGKRGGAENGLEAAKEALGEEVVGETVIIDAAALEDEDAEGDDDDIDGDHDQDEETSTLVAAPQDADIAHDVDPAVNTDDSHLEASL